MLAGERGAEPAPATAAGVHLAAHHGSMESQPRPALKLRVTATRTAAWPLPPPVTTPTLKPNSLKPLRETSVVCGRDSPRSLPNVP